MSEDIIQEEKQGPLKTTLIVGGILSAVMLLYNYLFIWSGDMGDMEKNRALGYLQYIFFLGFGLAAIKIHRDKNLNGEIGYGQAFITALLTILWLSIVMAIVTYIFFKINPEKADEIMQKGLEAMDKRRDKGEMSDEDFDKAKKVMEWINGAVPMAITSFLSCLVPGIITSLIAAAFHKLIKSNKA